MIGEMRRSLDLAERERADEIELTKVANRIWDRHWSLLGKSSRSGVLEVHEGVSETCRHSACRHRREIIGRLFGPTDRTFGEQK